MVRTALVENTRPLLAPYRMVRIREGLMDRHNDTDVVPRRHIMKYLDNVSALGIMDRGRIGDS